MSPERCFSPSRVQHALVCMLFDPRYAARVRGQAELPELDERERQLLRTLDPRALATDDMRRARALHVLLDEFPVTTAVLGLDRVDSFFASEPFRRCVFERGAMALAFGRDFVGNRAKGIGQLETAMARARRPHLRLAQPSPTTTGPTTTGPTNGPPTDPSPTVARAPGVEALTVPDKTLAWYQRARQRLAPDPIQALAKLRKPWPKPPPRRGAQHLLITPATSPGSFDLGLASQALVDLLQAADRPRPHPDLTQIAINLGATPDEAEDLLDELTADGLLHPADPDPSTP